MIRYIYIVAVLIVALLSGCGQTSSNKQKNAEPADNGITVVQLFEVAGQNIGKDVVIKGAVTHVCQHSGQRCFIADDSGEQTIRVEAKGDIGSFSKELVGADIQVKGVLRESRIEETSIDEKEQKALTMKEEEGESDHCASELASVEKMRQWMKDNGKDYYAVYYIDGLEYEVLN